MKNFLILFFLVISFESNSQIKYLESFEKALNQAKLEKKLVFVKFYGETCSHCKKLQEALDVDSIANLYSKYFVSFKINSENLTAVDQEFLDKYKFNINQIPYMFFFNPEGEFIHFATPSQTVKGVYNVAFDVLNPDKRTSNLVNKYKAGNADLNTLKMYSKLAQLMDDGKLVNQLADDIFEIYPKEELLTKASIVTLAKYVKSIDNGFFQFWLEKYASFDTLVLEFKLEEKQKVIKDILVDDINKSKKNWNLAQLENARKYVETIALSENSYIYTWQEEVDLHFKDKNENKILEILNGIQKEKSFFQLNYMMNYILSKLQKKESFDKYEIHLMTLDKRYTQIDEIELIFISKLKFYKLVENSKKFQQIKEEAINFYKTNNIPTLALDEI
jgi:thiol-disulfide isomerase/thioredoxin